MGGQARIFKTSRDFLESVNLVPYNKLEYLEKEIELLREEEEHLKWLKDMPYKEREWLIKQDFDELLKMNTRTTTEARNYVKRFYVDIKNNVESIDPGELNIKERFEQLNGEESDKKDG